MLRLVIAGSTLTDTVAINTSGSIDCYIANGNSVGLTAERQLGISEWVTDIEKRKMSDMLYGGSFSSNDNGVCSWGFSSGLNGVYITQSGYLRTLQSQAPGEVGDITLLPSRTVDVTGGTYTLAYSISADPIVTYSGATVTPSTLQTSNAASSPVVAVVLPPGHCRPLEQFREIDLMLWQLYHCVNSFSYRLQQFDPFADRFGNPYLTNYGPALGTYKNYQALVAYLNLQTWQKSFVLEVSPNREQAEIIFGYREPDCYHDRLRMTLYVDLSNFGGTYSTEAAQNSSTDVYDVAEQQPLTFRHNGLINTTNAAASVTDYRYYINAGCIYPGASFDPSWTEINGEAVEKLCSSGRPAFSGGKVELNIDRLLGATEHAITVGESYIINCSLTPVAPGGEAKYYPLDESDYTYNQSHFIATVTGIWEFLDGSTVTATYQKQLNVVLTATIAGSTTSSTTAWKEQWLCGTYGGGAQVVSTTAGYYKPWCQLIGYKEIQL